MAFATRKLTPRQSEQLKSIYAADQHWRNLKQTARAELERQLEERLSEALRVRDMEVRTGFDMSIPKARISRDGLSTTAPVTINESLTRTEAYMEQQKEGRQKIAEASKKHLHPWLKTGMFAFHTMPERVADLHKYTVLAARPGFSVVGFMRAHATTPAQEEFMAREGKFQPFELAVPNRGASALVFVSDEFPQGRTEWFEWPGVDPAGNNNPEWAFLRDIKTGSTEPNARPGQLFVAWLAENGVPESLFTPTPQAAPAPAARVSANAPSLPAGGYTGARPGERVGIVHEAESYNMPAGFTPPSMTTAPPAPAPGSVPVYAPQPVAVPEFSEEDLDEGDGEDGF